MIERKNAQAINDLAAKKTGDGPLATACCSKETIDASQKPKKKKRCPDDDHKIFTSHHPRSLTSHPANWPAMMRHDAIGMMMASDRQPWPASGTPLLLLRRLLLATLVVELLVSLLLATAGHGWRRWICAGWRSSEAAGWVAASLPVATFATACLLRALVAIACCHA